LNGVDLQAYFADVLIKLVNLWPAARIDELMPWAWGSAKRIAAPGEVDQITAWSSFLASPEAPKTAMSALALDGYLTGVVGIPQAAPIRPNAWVPRIWGDEEPIFADEAQINTVLGAVMAHYNTLLHDINRSLDRLEADRVVDYRPLFPSGDEKPSHDTVRIWVRGFGKAMALAPKTWTALARDERTSIIISSFVGFVDLAEPKPREVPGDLVERLGPGRRPHPGYDPPSAHDRPHARSRQPPHAAPWPKQNRPQRSLPLRVTQEIQTLLRCPLIRQAPTGRGPRRPLTSNTLA
jgi:yecA family protein